IRIHTRPARFMWRVMARRAASICRAVIRSGSIAFSPYWPNARSVPLVAIPLIRPLCALRNLVRDGCSMAQCLSSGPVSLVSGRVATRATRFALGQLLVLRHWVVLEDLAFEDPNFHAAGPVCRKGGRNAVIDIRTQRVQGHPTLAVPLHARDLRAAKPAGAIDPNAFGAEPHRRLHGALHGAAEGHAPLELLSDRLGHELSVEFGLADLDDVDDDIGVGEVRDFLPQLLDIGALLADDDAGARRVDRHPALLVWPLDHDLRHRRLLEAFEKLLTDLHVFVQKLAVFILAGVPARIPRPVDAQTQAYWIDLLTHRSAPTRLLPRPHERRS